MNLLQRLVPGEGLLLLIASTAGIIAVVVALAEVIRWVLVRRPAAMRHDVLRVALLVVLLSPALAAIVAGSGFAIAALPKLGAGGSASEPAKQAEPIANGPDALSSQTLPRGLARGIAPEPESDSPKRLESGRPEAAKSALDDPPKADFGSDPGGEGRPRPVSRAGMHGARTTRATRAVFDARDSKIDRPIGWRSGGLVLAWAIGAGLLAARLIHGLVSMARLRRRFRPIDPARLTGVREEVASALGARALPPIVESAGVSGPMAGGIARPVVVLPVGLVESLNPAALRDVLIHECGHALRRDPLVGLFQRVAAMIFWPHPMVHWLNRSLSRAREDACDDLVLSRGDACEYARTLLLLAERSSGRGGALAVGLFETRGRLEGRIASILDPRRTTMTRSHRGITRALAALLSMTGLATAAIRPVDDEPARPAAVAETGEPKTTITGVVVDEAGKPVAGASVNVTWFRAAKEDVTTDAAGRFTLSIGGPMRANETVRASADGGAKLGIAEYQEPIFETSQPVRIVLKPSRMVSTHVRDAEGRPVAGAAVEIQSSGPLARAETDAQGRASLRIPADATVRAVVALKDGVGFDYFEGDGFQASRDGLTLPDEVPLTLDGARSGTINTVGPDGKPRPGVSFRPSLLRMPGKISNVNLSGSDLCRITTDARGEARVPWLPKSLTRQVVLNVDPWNWSVAESVILPASGDFAIRAKVQEHVRLSGKVANADGSPVKGVVIQAEGRGLSPYYGRRMTRTGEDGRYRLSVPVAQSYLIATLDPDRAARPLSGIVTQVGRDVEGMDFTLREGSHLRGRITNADGTPAAGTRLTCILLGKVISREMLNAAPLEARENLVFWFKADAQGRYKIPVGPGEYELYASATLTDRQPIAVAEKPEEIDRDFTIRPQPAQVRTKLAGRVIDATGAANRPVPGAIVRILGIGAASGVGREGRADGEGHFAAELPSAKVMIYARDAAGTIAGYVRVPDDPHEIGVSLAPAAKATGRVLDPAGRPIVGKSIQININFDLGREGKAMFTDWAVTDAAGEYAISGLVPGTSGWIYVMHEDAGGPSFRVQTREFSVKGPDPIVLPDITVPAPERGRPAIVLGPDPVKRATPVLLWGKAPMPYIVSRADAEALVKAVGRDPVTPELVDLIFIKIRPMFTWIIDLDKVRKIATDPGFVARVDRISKEIQGKPADTKLLISLAMVNPSGRDDDLSLADSIRTAIAPKPPIPIRGTVIDAETKKPVADAVVFRSREVVRTDAEGRFSLATGSTRRLWVEAEGYALREANLPEKEADKPLEIALVKEVPIWGTVVSNSGMPLPGAIVWAMVNHTMFGTEKRAGSDSNGFPLTARTDEQGRFVFRGMPPGATLTWYEVRHPGVFLPQEKLAPLSANGPPTITVEIGCVIAGVVVDETGRGIAGANVRVRHPQRGDTALEAITDSEGRYRFANVPPGRWDVVVEPVAHAARRISVIASPGRPAENQVLVEPGGSLFGKVIDADGKPVANVMVGWLRPLNDAGEPDEGFSLNRWTRTADDGTFRIGPVPQGRIEVTALTSEPRLLGRAKAAANQADVVITLKPDGR